MSTRNVVTTLVLAALAAPAAHAQRLPTPMESKAFRAGFAALGHHRTTVTGVVVSEADARWAIVRYTRRPRPSGADRAVAASTSRRIRSVLLRRSGASARPGRPSRAIRAELRAPLNLYLIYDVPSGRASFDAFTQSTDECAGGTETWSARYREDVSMRWHAVYEIPSFGVPRAVTADDVTGRPHSYYGGRILAAYTTLDVVDTKTISDVHSTSCDERMVVADSCTERFGTLAEDGLGQVDVADGRVTVSSLPLDGCGSGNLYFGSHWWLETFAAAPIDLLGRQADPFAPHPVGNTHPVETAYGIHQEPDVDCTNPDANYVTCTDHIRWEGTLRLSTTPR